MMTSSNLDAALYVCSELDKLAERARTTLELCDLAEERILGLAREITLDQLSTIAKMQGWRFHSATKGRFYRDTQLYEVRVTQATTPTLLQMAVCPATRDGSLDTFPAPLKVSLDGNGRYSALHLFLDSLFMRYQDRIAVELQVHFRAGYRWLEARVMADLLEFAHELAIEFYVDIRSVLDQPLADLVALYVVDRTDAYYMLDPRAIQTALTHAISRRGGTDESAIELTTLLVTQMLNPGETVAQASLTERRPLDVPLEQSKYVDTGLQVAEHVFYDSMSLVSQPLVCDGELRVTAVYPYQVRAQVAKPLEFVAARMRETLAKNGHRAARRIYGDRAYPLIDEHKIDRIAEVAGLFGGGFAGAYTDTLT